MAEISTMPKAVIDNAKEIAKKISSEKQVQKWNGDCSRTIEVFLHFNCLVSLLWYCICAPLLYGHSGLLWPWSYDTWIYNYLCSQCLSPLTVWVRILLRRGVIDTTLCDKVCQWFVTIIDNAKENLLRKAGTKWYCHCLRTIQLLRSFIDCFSFNLFHYCNIVY